MNINIVLKEDTDSNFNVADGYEILKEDIPVADEFWNNDRPDVDDNYGVIYDRTNDADSPSLTPESYMPYIHSIIGEVNKEF